MALCGGEQPVCCAELCSAARFYFSGGIITWSWSTLPCDMCTSVLNLKPLPYQTALTKPLMNVSPLPMQKKQNKTSLQMSRCTTIIQDDMLGHQGQYIISRWFQTKAFTHKRVSHGIDFLISMHFKTPSGISSCRFYEITQSIEIQMY